jgi:hypothetical protein
MLNNTIKFQIKFGQHTPWGVNFVEDQYPKNIENILKWSRNLGYGTKIIQYCINKSHSYGAKHIVFESTTEGLGLYKKLGFFEMRKSYVYSLYQQ